MKKIKYISGADIKKGMILKTVYNTWGEVIEVTENAGGGHNYILRDTAGRVDLRYINPYTEIPSISKSQYKKLID